MVKVLLRLAKEETTPEEQEQVTTIIAGILEQAQALGHTHAARETHERLLTGFHPIDMARNIVRNFLQRIAERFQKQTPQPTGEPDTDNWQSFDDWAQGFADTVAQTEIHSAIERAVLDELSAQEERTVTWITQPGACKLCLENEAQGAIPIGDLFPSGDEAPPAHPYCRCSLGVP
jgi:hypothetical protein